MALCTSDGNQRSFVRDRIERRAAERISHSARCEPRPHLGSIFFFLSTLCVGERAAARPERQRTLSLLSFNDSKVFLYLLFFFFVLPALWLCLFLPPSVSLSLSLSLSYTISLSLSVSLSFLSFILSSSTLHPNSQVAHSSSRLRRILRPTALYLCSI